MSEFKGKRQNAKKLFEGMHWGTNGTDHNSSDQATRQTRSRPRAKEDLPSDVWSSDFDQSGLCGGCGSDRSAWKLGATLEIK